MNLLQHHNTKEGKKAHCVYCPKILTCDFMHCNKSDRSLATTLYKASKKNSRILICQERYGKPRNTTENNHED